MHSVVDSIVHAKLGPWWVLIDQIWDCDTSKQHFVADHSDAFTFESNLSFQIYLHASLFWSYSTFQTCVTSGLVLLQRWRSLSRVLQSSFHWPHHSIWPNWASSGACRVMKSLSPLVSDSEDCSGELLKAISSSVTELFTVFSLREWLLGIWTNILWPGAWNRDTI